MYSVSAGFLTGILSNRYIDYTGTIGLLNLKTDAVLQSIVIDRKNQTNKSIVGNAIPIEASIVLSGVASTYDFYGEEVLITLGLLVSSTYEYVPFAPMKVYESTYNQDDKTWTLTCYDALYEGNNKTIDEITFSYPITYLDYITTVCNEIGISLGTTDFLNYDVILDSEPNFDGTETLKSVIAYFAEAILCNAYIGREKNGLGKSVLYLKPILNTSDPYEIERKYTTCSIGSKYGKVNSLILGRSPQNDNVYLNNEASISADGLTELVINNNPFLDYGSGIDTRYDIIQSLYDSIIGDELDGEVVVDTLHNLTIYAYDLKYRCNWALDQYDNISVIDTDGVTEYVLIYPGDKITYNGGIECTTSIDVSSQNEVDYNIGASLKDIVKNTYIRVDKVEQEITSVADIVSGNTENITTILQNVESINATITSIGGQNLILNSSGIGGLDQWTYGVSDDITTEYDYESLAKTRFNVVSGTLSQTINVIQNKLHTLSFKYKKTDGSDLSVTLDGASVLSTTDEQSEYLQVIYEFTPTVSSMSIVISCDISYAYITELMICASEVTSWSQAANEIYTTGVNVTKDGISVSQSGSKTNTTIDSSGTRVLKQTNNEVVSAYTDTGGFMQNLEVGYKIVLGNFEDFVPNDTTVMHSFIRR